MVDDTQLILDLSLGVDKLNTQIGAIQNQLAKAGEDSGDKFGKGFESKLPGLLKVISTIVGAASAVAGAFSLKAAIEEASQAEQAINRLNVALASSGNYSKEASSSIQLFAEELQKTTTFSDDAVISSAALIENLAKLDTEGLKKATVAATDLSAALGIDLQSASEIVAKAANGNTTALSKLGFEFQKGASDSEKFAQALAQIEQRFGGQAQAQLYTFAGATSQLKNSINDVFEEFGKVIIQNPQVIALIRGLGQVFLNLKNIIIENASVISGWVSGFVNGLSVAFSVSAMIADKIVAVFAVLSTKIGQAFDYVYKKVLDTFDSISKFLAPIISSVSSVIGSAFNQVDSFLNSGNPIATFFNAGIDSISTQGQTFLAGMQGFIQQVNQSITDAETGQSVFQKLFAPLSSDNLAAIASNVDAFAGQYVNSTNAISKQTEDVAKKAEFDLKTRIGNGVSSAVQSMTTAFLQGKNVLQAFSGAILSIIGDLAIQLGTFFIINGIAIEALKSISGLGAVAAGVALVALGTIMKSLGSAGAGSGAGAGGAGGFAPGGYAAEPGTIGQLGTVESQKKGAEVNVTVQGNVFNQRETGLEIAKIIRDSFEQEGITTVGAV